MLVRILGSPCEAALPSKTTGAAFPVDDALRTEVLKLNPDAVTAVGRAGKSSTFVDTARTLVVGLNVLNAPEVGQDDSLQYSEY